MLSYHCLVSEQRNTSVMCSCVTQREINSIDSEDMSLEKRKFKIWKRLNISLFYCLCPLQVIIWEVLELLDTSKRKGNYIKCFFLRGDSNYIKYRYWLRHEIFIMENYFKGSRDTDLQREKIKYLYFLYDQSNFIHKNENAPICFFLLLLIFNFILKVSILYVT